MGRILESESRTRGPAELMSDEQSAAILLTLPCGWRRSVLPVAVFFSADGRLSVRKYADEATWSAAVDRKVVLVGFDTAAAAAVALELES